MSGAICLASLVALMSGVLPSPSVTTGVRSVTGRNFRYSSITPRQRFIALFVLALDPDQGGGLGDKGHAIDRSQCRLDMALRGGMGLDHDRNRLPFAPSLLEDGRDTDTAPAQLPCNLRQDAGAVQHHKTEVIERADFFHRPHPKRTPLVLLERSGWDSPYRPFQQIARDGDEIADHRAAGRHRPRAPAIEHHIAHGIAA